MNAEEVAIHCMISVIVIAIGFLHILIWKYLNSKSTGRQTFTDEMAKDGLIILYPTILFNWLTWIKFGDNYNYYVAMFIVKISQFSQIMAVGQGIIFHITRYLSVFHFEFINSVNEKTLKKITRSLILALSIICCLTEDRSKTLKMLNLINSTIDEGMYSFKPVTSVIVRLTGIAVLGIVQIRIVLYRRKHPIGNNEKENFNPKFVAFVCFLSIVHVAAVAISSYIAFVEKKIIAELTRIYIICFDFLIFTVIIIYSNENMLAYILNSAKKTHLMIVSVNNFEMRHVTNASIVGIAPKMSQSKIEGSNSVVQIESPVHVQENVPQILIVTPAPE